MLYSLQVKAFCDVDENKIKKGFYTYEESKVRSFNFMRQAFAFF